MIEPGFRERARAGFYKQRRGRNLALLAVLLALSGLFFAITLAKLSNSRPHRPVSWSAPLQPGSVPHHSA